MPEWRQDVDSRRQPDGAADPRVVWSSHRARPGLRDGGGLCGNQLHDARETESPPVRLAPGDDHSRCPDSDWAGDLWLGRRRCARPAIVPDQRGLVRRLPDFTGDRERSRPAEQWHDACRRLEPDTPHSHDERQPAAGRLLARADDRGEQGWRVHGNQPQVEHRRQAPQLSVRHPARVRDRQRQARPVAQERDLRRHHTRVLELLRRGRRSLRMEGVGPGQLRQRPATADGPRRARRVTGALPARQGRHPEMKSMETARLTEQAEVKRFIDKLLQASPAAQTEVMVTEWDSALTRFANNGIHQNVAERDVSVRVRVVKDGKTGVASINQMNEKAAADVLKRAIAIADLQSKGETVPMPGRAKSQPVEAWSDATAAATPEERADFVEAICAKARRAGLKAFGAVSTSAGQLALANSLGVIHHQRSTQASANSVVMGEAGSGYADRGAIDVRDLDKGELADEVIEKAQRNQNAQPVEPGVYEVVLEEYAVAEMLDFMSFMGFSALAAQEERSFMRLGEQITGDQVSIWDDGLDRTGLPASFDFEGVPKQRVDLIRGGVASGLVYDQMTAQRAGRQSTGHGLPAPNTDGPFAVNLFMKPGTAAKADLMSDIK